MDKRKNEVVTRQNLLMALRQSQAKAFTDSGNRRGTENEKIIIFTFCFLHRFCNYGGSCNCIAGYIRF